MERKNRPGWTGAVLDLRLNWLRGQDFGFLSRGAGFASLRALMAAQIRRSASGGYKNSPD
jgi:hypothetical protein